jgi:hypothetical protein
VSNRVFGDEDTVPEDALEKHIVTWPLKMPKAARRKKTS